jgi:methionyl aminopeptidase
MGRGQHNLVCSYNDLYTSMLTMAEHTLLVTENGVEILTARFPDSPGGPVPMPVPATKEVNGAKKEETAS